MTNEEAKSCIDTIKMLRRSAYNMYGVIDVIDSDNCEKIIKVLSDIPKYKDAYGKGWDDGAKASYEHLKMCEEEEEPTGHWIIKDGKEQGYDIAGVKTWYIQIMCDKCGFIKTAIEGHTGQYRYCPSCGHRMIDSQESEVNNG